MASKERSQTNLKGEPKTGGNLDSSESLCISIPAAAKLLGVSRGTAYLMARLDQLPVIRCGSRRLVVPLPSLRRMLEGKDDGSSPSPKLEE